MQKFERFFNFDDFVPDLRKEFEDHPLNLKQIILVAVAVKKPNDPKHLELAEIDRRQLCVSDGKESLCWETESLKGLFRGNKQPPVLGDYPEAYNDSFALLDLHALEISKISGDRRDSEMKEIYSVLRRRPDGRSLG